MKSFVEWYKKFSEIVVADRIYNESPLVQVMTWGRQAPWTNADQNVYHK